MPIFEYSCKACGKVFEHLARTASDKPGKCPKCGSAKFEKQLSTFSPSAGGHKHDVPSCASGACNPGACSGGSCPFAA